MDSKGLVIAAILIVLVAVVIFLNVIMPRKLDREQKEKKDNIK